MVIVAGCGHWSERPTLIQSLRVNINTFEVVNCTVIHSQKPSFILIYVITASGQMELIHIVNCNEALRLNLSLDGRFMLIGHIVGIGVQTLIKSHSPNIISDAKHSHCRDDDFSLTCPSNFICKPFEYSFNGGSCLVLSAST